MPGIVIIEDDALMRSLLTEWLATEGYAVSATAEVEPMPGAAPSLVIVDVYMPRRLGTQRLRAARAAYPGVPVIAISSQFCAGVDWAGRTARALGVQGVIAKPCGREALLDLVRSVIASTVAESPGACRF